MSYEIGEMIFGDPVSPWWLALSGISLAYIIYTGFIREPKHD